MNTTALIILVVFIITAPVCTYYLVIKYGPSWRYKKLKPFDKFVYIYLWTIIVIWFAYLAYAVCTLPVTK